MLIAADASTIFLSFSALFVWPLKAIMLYQLLVPSPYLSNLMSIVTSIRVLTIN